jgi:3'(2'), 5'-bisphosphate nucleotidase
MSPIVLLRPGFSAGAWTAELSWQLRRADLLEDLLGGRPRLRRLLACEARTLRRGASPMPADDHRLAAELAEQAGRQLLLLRSRGGDPDDLRKAGDASSHEFLSAQIAARCPGDAILSEEGRDDAARLTSDRVWIVDPLDGTREFGEAGRSDWAVHVALWDRCELTAGAVALPAQDRVLSTAEPPDQPEPPQATAASVHSLRIVVSRSRPPAFAARVAEDIGATLVPLGSAGAKAAAVILGETDAYLHDGGQYEWDSAAPVAVALAAGLHASRLDGSKLEYNKAVPWQPDILICPGKLADRLLTAIGAVRAGNE